MKKLTEAQQFFYDHAGYSYDPKRETAEQGRANCADHLAKVEAYAKQVGIRFEWEKDDIDSRDFSDEKPYYKLHVCIAYLNGKVVGSLGGIDFGRNGSPHGNTYKRVVEAELACDAYSEFINSHDAACRDIATITP